MTASSHVVHTRWRGRMGDLRRGKWIRDARFVSGRDECVCETVGDSSMLRLMCNTDMVLVRMF